MNMKLILKALGERKDQADATINIFRRRTRKFLTYLLILSFIQVGINIVGFKTVNTFLGFLEALALILFMSSPKLIWAALGVAAYSDKITAEDALKELANILFAAMFAATMFSFILSTFQISRNYSAIPIIYLAVIIIFLFDAVWNIKTSFSKKFLYFYTLVYLIVAIGSLISGTVYNKIIGFDPYFI
jgi:hypothetical protein